MKCQYCGNAIPEDAAVCPNCGAAVMSKEEQEAIEEPSDRSLTTFLMLSLVPLPFGQGFFYIRNPRLGVLTILAYIVIPMGLGFVFDCGIRFEKNFIYGVLIGYPVLWILQIVSALVIKKDGDGKRLKK